LKLPVVKKSLKDSFTSILSQSIVLICPATEMYV
jgi:hypothetical protein